MAEPRLEAHEFSVDIFDESSAARRRLVSNVSFVLPAGQGLGITGESGSGKTTLSLALSGLLPSGSHTSALRFTANCGGRSIELDSSRGPHLYQPMRSLRGGTLFTLFQEPRSSLNPYRKYCCQLHRCII